MKNTSTTLHEGTILINDQFTFNWQGAPILNETQTQTVYKKFYVDIPLEDIFILNQTTYQVQFRNFIYSKQDGHFNTNGIVYTDQYEMINTSTVILYKTNGLDTPEMLYNEPFSVTNQTCKITILESNVINVQTDVNCDKMVSNSVETNLITFPDNTTMSSGVQYNPTTFLKDLPVVNTHSSAYVLINPVQYTPTRLTGTIIITFFVNYIVDGSSGDGRSKIECRNLPTDAWTICGQNYEDFDSLSTAQSTCTLFPIESSFGYTIANLGDSIEIQIYVYNSNSGTKVGYISTYGNFHQYNYMKIQEI